jgi:chaperonin GroES
MAKQTFKPISDRLIVKPLDNEEVTEGGILLPDMENQRTLRGEVVAAGSGRVSDTGAVVPMTVRVGDVVVYQKFAATVVDIDGIEYHTMKEVDIVVILQS